MCPGSAVMLAGMWSEVRGGKGPLGTQGNVCLRKISLSEHEPLGFVFTSPLFIFKDAIFWVHRELRIQLSIISHSSTLTETKSWCQPAEEKYWDPVLIPSCASSAFKTLSAKNALNSDPPTKQPNTKSLFYLYKHLYAILLLHWTSWDDSCELRCPPSSPQQPMSDPVDKGLSWARRWSSG